MAEFVFIIAKILGVLFVFSGIIKMSDLKGFSKIVIAYNMLPLELSRLMGYVLPFVELIIGGILLNGGYVFYGAVVGLLQLIVVTFALMKIYKRKKKMENCGCFGTSIKVPVSKRKLAENVFWIILLVYVVVQSYPF